jgi:hypothetical protein
VIQMSYKEEVIEYFAQKADAYDAVIHQPYWVLSDKLLWHFFKDLVLDTLPSDFRFLDAGGGTGRWTDKILASYPRARGLIYDFLPT